MLFSKAIELSPTDYDYLIARAKQYDISYSLCVKNLS